MHDPDIRCCADLVSNKATALTRQRAIEAMQASRATAQPGSPLVHLRQPAASYYRPASPSQEEEGYTNSGSEVSLTQAEVCTLGVLMLG